MTDHYNEQREAEEAKGKTKEEFENQLKKQKEKDDIKKVEEQIKDLESKLKGSKNVEAPSENKPEVKKQVQVQQRHPFIQINGEAVRTYKFPGNEVIQIPNVIGLSICPNGDHRLLVSNNGAQIAYRIPNRWLVIEYVAKEGPYVFAE